MMRRLVILACLGLAACTSDSPTTNDTDTRSTSELYTLKGVQYIETGRLDVAKLDLQKAIELDSNNAEAHNALGVLSERLNQPEEAEKEFKLALSIDANNTGAANNYGRLLCARGQYEQSMKYFQKLIDNALYPTPWLALTNAGLCAKSQGLAADAENYLRRALESAPDFGPALLEMAKLSQERGNYMSARAFLQRYDALGVETAESLATGVQTERALGNTKDANAYLKKLLRLFPNSKEAQLFRH